MESNLRELRDRFANPKRVERALLADGVDPTVSTAVQAWLTDNGDDFARRPPESDGAEWEAPTPRRHPTPGVSVLIPDPVGEQERVEAWLEASGQALWSAPVVK